MGFKFEFLVCEFVFKIPFSTNYLKGVIFPEVHQFQDELVKKSATT